VIIVQTPLRISFFGGGTDFSQFTAQEDGCVLATAIDRYIFVILKERFDDLIRVGYTRTELVHSIDALQHELVRETLRRTGIDRRIEISTMADIPSAGSGLGSSSTVTIGLLNAMYHHLGDPRDLATLAREACEIEIGVLRRPIGKQDQYIAAFGGLRFIRFHGDGSTDVETVRIPPARLRRLNENLMIFYTNTTRKAESVLTEQVSRIDSHREVLREMKALAFRGREALESGELDEFGRLLHAGWELKKQMASGITTPGIDQMYAAARRAGATGGKIAGAGGGGFLLLYCPHHRQNNVRLALNGYAEMPFRFEHDGTKVIFNYPRQSELCEAYSRMGAVPVPAPLVRCS
jgi:D-glycero-alpha-D-manno-heptose-7-phosphate kinase